MKERSTNTSIQTKLMKDAVKKIKPPKSSNLSKQDMIYWEAIVSNRHEWNDLDLFLAANLAKTLRLIDEETLLIEGEGTVILGGKNMTTPVVNPHHTVLESLTRRSILLTTKLQVHAQATMGESREQKSRNGKKKDAIEAFDDLDDDDLIARPH